MPTQEKVQRKRAREMWNNRCCLCGEGPLNRNAMHLTTSVFVPATEYGPMPVCTSCRDLLAERPFSAAIAREMKRHAKAYIKLMRIGYLLGMTSFPAGIQPMSQRDADEEVERMVERAKLRSTT